MIHLWCRHTFRPNFSKQEEKKKKATQATALQTLTQRVRRSETIVITSRCSRGGFWGKPPTEGSWWFSPPDDERSCKELITPPTSHSLSRGRWRHFRQHGWSDRSTQHQNANLKPISADSKLQIPGEIATEPGGEWGCWVWDAAQIENESMQPGREKKLSLEGKLLCFKGASEIEVSEDVLWNQWKQFNEKKKYRTFHYLYPVLNQDTEPFHPCRAIVSSSFHPSCQGAYGSDCNTTGNDGGQWRVSSPTIPETTKEEKEKKKKRLKNDIFLKKKVKVLRSLSFTFFFLELQKFSPISGRNHTRRLRQTNWHARTVWHCPLEDVQFNVWTDGKDAPKTK